MKKVFCLAHNQEADFICLNKECKSKKVVCPSCKQEEGQQNVNCVELHKEDVLVMQDFSEQKFSQTYDSIRGQYLKEEEQLFRQMAILNKFKFEQLGKDFYYYLQEMSLKNVKTKSEKISIQNFDEFVGYNTSQIKFRKIMEDFAQYIEFSQTQIQENKLDNSQIINLENLGINNIADQIQSFTSDLISCQLLFENMSRYQEIFTDYDIENLLKKLKKIIQEFIDKKTKKINKKRQFPQDQIAKFESKLLQEEQEAPCVVDEPLIIKTKQEENVPKFHSINEANLDSIFLEQIQPSASSMTKIEDKQTTIVNEDSNDILCSNIKKEANLPISSGGSITEIDDLQVQNDDLNNQKGKYLKMLNKIQLKLKNKIYRLKISPNHKQISVTCGGWDNSSGDCILFDIDFYQSDFKLKKIINFGNFKFVDSSFTPCGKFLFLTAKNKVFVYKTEFEVQSKNVDKKQVLKISTSYEVRAIEVQNLNLSKEIQKQNQLTVAIGGNSYFELISVKLDENEYTYKRDFIAVVQGQVENIKFCFSQQFVAYTVYESQQISLFDIKQKQICFISQPLGFYIWYMQIVPNYEFIAVSGENSQIQIFSLDLSNYSLSLITNIETQFSEIITAFDFYKNYVFITCSDNSLKIFQSKSKSQTNEIYYEKVYSSSPELHKMPTLAFSPIYKQIFTGCQNGMLLRWQFTEDHSDNDESINELQF